jgi:hypothetical protein
MGVQCNRDAEGLENKRDACKVKLGGPCAVLSAKITFTGHEVILRRLRFELTRSCRISHGEHGLTVMEPGPTALILYEPLMLQLGRVLRSTFTGTR